MLKYQKVHTYFIRAFWEYTPESPPKKKKIKHEL